VEGARVEVGTALQGENVCTVHVAVITALIVVMEVVVERCKDGSSCRSDGTIEDDPA